MKTYVCPMCESKYFINSDDRSIPFSYSGKVYEIQKDRIFRVVVMGFIGTTCHACAGFARDVIRQDGIRLGNNWLVFPNGSKVFWTQRHEIMILFTYTEDILTITTKNRIPIPRKEKSGPWFVKSGDQKISLGCYGCMTFSPWPELHGPLLNFPLVLAGLGISTDKIVRNGNTFTCNDHKIHAYDFPQKNVGFGEVSEETWQLLEEQGHKYAITYNGIVYIPNRSLI